MGARRRSDVSESYARSRRSLRRPHRSRSARRLCRALPPLESSAARQRTHPLSLREDELMLKRLCQCIGLASLILVINYGDLLGGGSDVRMHTPFSLARICYAQIADIFIVALFLFGILTAAAHT